MSTVCEPQPNILETRRRELIEEKLRIRNDSLEEALANLEEEMQLAEIKSKETIANLHYKIDNLETDNNSLESQLNAKSSKTKALVEEIKNINTGFNQKVAELKREIEALKTSKQKKIKEEKEGIKKEKKLLKKKKQKAKKEEENQVKKFEKVLENNNSSRDYSKVESEQLRTLTCDFVAKAEDQLENRAMEVYKELMKLANKVHVHNDEVVKLLENVPYYELILTQEEITQLGIDWKIHLEILEITGQHEEK